MNGLIQLHNLGESRLHISGTVTPTFNYSLRNGNPYKSNEFKNFIRYNHENVHTKLYRERVGPNIEDFFWYR